MRELIVLEPVFKETIWGGNRLHTDYHYDIPSDHTGECWAISAHPNGDCKVVEGDYAGMTLRQLWDTNREVFGNLEGDQFPLLIKIIDAKADLSIQVHPDDAYAAVHEKGSLGKTECWYILDCDDDAQIVIGHHAKDSQEVADMIHDRRWKDFIRVIPVKKGDFFQINPGCVHAIKTGTLILETQQSSDITYRVYDYDRLSDGKPRQLHVEESIAVIKAPFEASTTKPQEMMIGDTWVTKLVTCDYYTVDKLEVKGSVTFTQDKPFVNVSILEGTGFINDRAIQKGDHFIIPADFGDYTFSGDMMVITSSVTK